MLSILVSKASQTQSTQNNEFAKYLQYLKKEMKDGNNSWYQSFPQVCTTIFHGRDQACLKYSN